MDVSIIIVNYNTKKLTKNCIDSIFDKTKDVEFEVILVDNDSKDGSQEIFSKDSRIKFVESGGNLGFGRANNLGLQYATGKYIFFLNSDTILLNNAVKIFKDFYDKHGEGLHLGGIGCQLQAKDGELIHSGNYFPNWKEDLKAELRDHWSTINHRTKAPRKTIQMLASPFDPMKVDYVTGADLFVKKDILEKYGAFDPAFFMYNEESEMQFRWHKYDVNQYLIDGPQIVHLEGVSMNKVRESISKEMIHAKSRILYYRLTLNKLNYFIYRLFLLLIRTPHIVIERGSVRDKIRYFLILSH